MEDAEALRPTVLADAHTVREFIRAASGGIQQPYGTWKAALNAAERLLENAQQSQDPPRPEPFPLVTAPDELRRIHTTIKDIQSETIRLAQRDNDLSHSITEANERCEALEVRIDSLEVGVGSFGSRAYVDNLPENRHQGLSDPMG